MTGFLIRKGGEDRHTQKRPCEDQEEDSHLQARRKALEETNPANALTLGF